MPRAAALLPWILLLDAVLMVAIVHRCHTLASGWELRQVALQSYESLQGGGAP